MKSAHPPDDVGRVVQSEGAPSGASLQRLSSWLPRVRHEVETRGTYAVCERAFLQLPGDHDHRIEASVIHALEPLEELALRTARHAGAVHGGDRGDPKTCHDATVEKVDPVAVRVDDVRPQ